MKGEASSEAVERVVKTDEKNEFERVDILLPGGLKTLWMAGYRYRTT